MHIKADCRETWGKKNGQKEKEEGKYTDKKLNQIFLIYKEIQNGAVAKSYMTNGLPIFG